LDTVFNQIFLFIKTERSYQEYVWFYSTLYLCDSRYIFTLWYMCLEKVQLMLIL